MNSNGKLGRHLASSSMWSLAGQIVSTISTLLFFGILARGLTPHDMGIYLLIMNVVMIASLAGTFGLQTTMVRAVASDLGAKNFASVAATVLSGNLMVLLLALVIGVILGGPIGAALLQQGFNISASKALMLLFGIWIVLNCCHISVTECFRGFHDIKRATLYGAAAKNTLLALLLTVGFILHGALSLELTLIAMNAALLVTLLLAIKHLNTHIQTTDSSAKPSLKTAYSLTRQSTPIFFTALAYQLFTRVGVFVLGYFVVKDELALYGAALQLVVLIIIPLRIVNSILPPIISNMYFNSSDHTKLEQTIRSVTSIATIPALFIILMLVFFGGKILTITYGAYYEKGHILLSLLAFGALSDVAFGPAGMLLTMTKNQNVLLRIQTTSMVLTAIATVIAAKFWGTTGVAFVAAFSIISQNFLTLLIAKRTTGIFCSTYVSPKKLFSVANGIKNLTGGFIKKS